MTLNGWHRLLIVMATAWALAVVGLTTLEYHAGEGQTGDGFFTCWEPTGAPTPPAKRYWNRDCGIFTRTWVAAGLFDGLPPGNRYLNTRRFLAVLLGPCISIGLFIVAFGWIASGFRLGPLPADAGRNRPGRASSLDRPDLPIRSQAEMWLDRTPRRWARNAAIGGALLAFPAILPLFAKGDGAAVAFMLAGLGLVILSSAGSGYLCGLWARWSLAAPFALNPASALARITLNWLTGVILLAALVLAGDALFGWRKTTPLFAGGIGFRDLGYLTGFFGTWVLGGYLTALMSKRGLRKAIEADRERSSARTASVSDGHALQREYSPG